ncbi:8-oxo-dGTP diphosphatase MutT [Pontibacter sp. MBLB2868]|uniref:8-oxo-dGTP diphosphatase MutT n=1 Tax=Pontibacter sp. MBLB2868 TaxID=3451555 RepID=UPI003F74DF21
MIEVTAGVIENNEKYLIARRAPGKHLAGLWEFPGGKLEAGETYEECLTRELKEELNLDVTVQDHIADSIFKYGDKQIHLRAYFAKSESSEVISIDHDEVRWVGLGELAEYDFAPADLPIINAMLIKREGYLSNP